MRGRRLYHGASALIALLALLDQLRETVYYPPDVGASLAAWGTFPARLLTYLSFFTTQSAILVLVGCAALALSPAREEPWFRWVRVASLIGITVTLLIDATVLRPITDDMHGGSVAVSDLLIHYVTPLAAIGGWLAFGPRDPFTRRALLRFAPWPALWVLYTFARGAIIAWYPYGFLDVTIHGYAPAVLGAVSIGAVVVGVAGSYMWLDDRLDPRPGAAAQLTV